MYRGISIHIWCNLLFFLHVSGQEYLAVSHKLWNNPTLPPHQKKPYMVITWHLARPVNTFPVWIYFLKILLASLLNFLIIPDVGEQGIPPFQKLTLFSGVPHAFTTGTQESLGTSGGWCWWAGSQCNTSEEEPQYLTLSSLFSHWVILNMLSCFPLFVSIYLPVGAATCVIYETCLN